MRKTLAEREAEVRDAEAELAKLNPLHNELVRKVREVKLQIRSQRLKLERAKNAIVSLGRRV